MQVSWKVYPTGNVLHLKQGNQNEIVIVRNSDKTRKCTENYQTVKVRTLTSYTKDSFSLSGAVGDVS